MTSYNTLMIPKKNIMLMIAALSKAYNETEDEVVIIHKEDFAFLLTDFGESEADNGKN